MPRERINLPPPLKTSVDEIQPGDQVLVRNAVLGGNGIDSHLASVIEIEEKEQEVIGIKEEGKQEEISADARIEEKNEVTDLKGADEQEQIAHEQTTSTAGMEELASVSANTESKLPSNRKRTLYYVHYIGTDRRLDEWVDASRICQAPPDPGTIPLTPIDAYNSGKTFLTRSQRRLNEDFRHIPKSFDDMDATTRKLEMEHEQRTKVKNVDKIHFGEYEIDAWYFSPFPISKTINRNKLYFCEFCLWYTNDQRAYTCHMFHKCNKGTPPPGEQVYEDKNLMVFEVSGKLHKTYCQSLCLLSKLFLDHKTLYYDVEGFLFYVLCEVDEKGWAHIVGHFSKELNSVNNLACIMVLPPYQRNGYGKLLIQLSYCLSEHEEVIGTPEKPLSDLGKVSYRSYWWWVLIGVLDREQVDASINVVELSRLSGIHVDDIVETFKTLQLIKYWRGDHIVRISKRIISQIKQLHLFRPPKLILRKSAVRWERTAKIREKSMSAIRESGGI